MDPIESEFWYFLETYFKYFLSIRWFTLKGVSLSSPLIFQPPYLANLCKHRVVPRLTFFWSAKHILSSYSTMSRVDQSNLPYNSDPNVD